MLNEIIKIDLHIHSKASEYKENGDIVKNSDINHVDTLLKKLNDEKINLFAITDHNRFDYKLYSLLKEKVYNKNNCKLYPEIKNILPGIEFDVLIEEGEKPCHIIAIFNDRDDKKLENIPNILSKDKYLIEKKEDYYDRETFEKILSEIGISTILIAHQKTDLDIESNTKSISCSVKNKYELYKILKVGYIDILEYQKPKVEGIVKNSLKSININFPLFTGSDCHEWDAYPFHHNDPSITNDKAFFTKIKCAPTFKGLLFATTSFETRASRINNQRQNYIKSITLNNCEYELSPNINVIIGDNGCGKTFLLDCLYGSIRNCYNQLKKTNDISINSNIKQEQIKYVKQNEIIDNVKNGSLMSATFYKEVPTIAAFKEDITVYINKLHQYILLNIEKEQILNKIKETPDLLIEISNKNRYKCLLNLNIRNQDDIHEIHVNKIQTIINELQTEIDQNSEYYAKYIDQTDLDNFSQLINKVLLTLKNHQIIITNNNKIINTIINVFKTTQVQLEEDRNSEEKELNSYYDLKNKFINIIVEAILINTKKVATPLFPMPKFGTSSNAYKGHLFIKKMAFDNKDVKEDFYKLFFNGNKNEQDVLSIKTKEDYKNSLTQLKDLDKFEEWKNKKLETFFEKMLTYETHIKEINSNKEIGATPGENSIVYYKFITSDTNDFSVLLFDQPEDAINPKKITETLNKYISSIRDEKQVIFATHNPLLVVNLDVDNVIFLQNENQKLHIQSGCLEYEHISEDSQNNYSIINLVEENLDGGHEAIKRRLNLYEENN